MRAVLIVAWLFVGLAGVIFHLGPGRELSKLDALDQKLTQARNCAASESWSDAVELYDQALVEMPDEDLAATRRVVLEKAKAQMMAKQLPDARETLGQLFVETINDPQIDPLFLSEVESALASSQYYLTWLMRLEGFEKEVWLPEIESARQHYAQISRRSEELGDQLAMSRSLEDLEAAVRLARMDLNELQSLPLPSQ